MRANSGRRSAPNKSRAAARTSNISPAPSESKIKPTDIIRKKRRAERAVHPKAHKRNQDGAVRSALGNCQKPRWPAAAGQPILPLEENEFTPAVKPPGALVMTGISRFFFAVTLGLNIGAVHAETHQISPGSLRAPFAQ